MTAEQIIERQWCGRFYADAGAIYNVDIHGSELRARGLSSETTYVMHRVALERTGRVWRYFDTRCGWGYRGVLVLADENERPVRIPGVISTEPLMGAGVGISGNIWRVS